MPLGSDTELRALLRETSSIAVVGVKAGQEDDAYRVPRYMQTQGYDVLPVSPKLRQVLGRSCVARLADLAVSPDLVNLFRAPQHLPAHVEEILGLEPRPRAVWLQLGIRHAEATQRLEAAGIAVVEDRCLMIEHRRLLAGGKELR